jgi:hypothetical protein
MEKDKQNMKNHKNIKIKKLTIVITGIFLILGLLVFSKKYSLAAVFIGQQDGKFVLRDPANPTPLLEVEPTTGEVSYAVLDAGKITLGGATFGEATENPLGSYYFPGRLGIGNMALMPLRTLDLYDGDILFPGNIYSGQTSIGFINASVSSPDPIPIKVGSLAINSANFNTAPATANSLYIAGKLGIGVTPAAAYPLSVNGQINTQGGTHGYCIGADCRAEWVNIGGQPLPTGTNGQTLYYNEGTAQWTNNSNLFNDGTNIGIGTTVPSAKTDVAGTIRAFNHINSAGYPVNDILIPQDIWNSSLNSMSGSLGLGISDWTQKLAATAFSASVVINRMSVTYLDNNNIFFAYKSNTDNYLYFSIYTPIGTQIKAPTAVTNYSISYNSVSRLNNGNVMLVFNNTANAQGMYAIYDSAGNQVKSPTAFTNTNRFGTNYSLNIKSLTNSNVVISYPDDSNRGSFVILDSSGNILKSPTVFNDASTAYSNLAAMSNGNFFLSYQHSDSKPYFQIFNSDGTQVKSATLINNNTIATSPSVISLNNGNILVAYSNAASNGAFDIYDQNGNIVADGINFNAGQTDYISATNLPDGNTLIAFETASNGYGNFVIYNSNGTLVKSLTTFKNSSLTYPIHTTTLPSGEAVIAFYNNTGSSGAYMVYQGSGANFARNAVVPAGVVGIGTTTVASGVFKAVSSDNTSQMIVLGKDAGDRGHLTLAAADSSKVSSIYMTNASNTNIWELSSRHTLNSPNYNFHVQYYNGASWLTPLAITTTGNVGITTTAPTVRLDLGAVQNSSQYCIAYNAPNYATSCINSTGAAHVSIEYGAYQNTSGTKIATDSWYLSLNMNAGGGHGWFYNLTSPGSTITPTRKMHLSDAGNLGIGVDNASYKLQVAGNIYVGGSSIDYKTNITDLEIDTGKIYQLNPVSFNYKDEYKEYGKILGGGKQIGLITEEVYKIIPELTISDGIEINNVDYEKLPVLLMVEIKKQKAYLDDLKNDKSILLEELTELENIAESLVN